MQLARGYTGGLRRPLVHTFVAMEGAQTRVHGVNITLRSHRLGTVADGDGAWSADTYHYATVSVARDSVDGQGLKSQ